MNRMISKKQKARLLLWVLLAFLLLFPQGSVFARNYASSKYSKNRWKLIQKDYLNTKTDRLIFVKYKSGTRATVEMWKKVTTTVEEEEEPMTLAETDHVEAVQASGTKKVVQWKKILSQNGYVGLNGIYKEREGDKKTPVGAFHVTMAFGIKKSPKTAGISYTKLNRYHYWSGEKDTYNTFVDARKLGRTWVAGEHLISYDPFYNYALAFDFNKKGVYKKGSAIFLHCTKPGRKYTAGCIAVTESKMKKIVQNTTKNTMIFIYPLQ